MFDVCNLKITAALNKNFSGYFVFITNKDCRKSPISHYPSFEVIYKLNCLLLAKKKILQKFLSSNEWKVTRNEQNVTINEQKVTSNEQKVTSKSNDQRAKSNDQRAENNEQRAKSNEQK